MGVASPACRRRTRAGRAAAAAATAVLTAGGLAACATSVRSGAPRTVVVTRTAAAPAPSSAARTAPGSSGSPGGTPSAVRTAYQSKLPGTCDDLLSLGSVDAALGRPVEGRTAFVVGVPEADIGRVGYLNCRYGLPSAGTGGAATPKVEIGVSLYRTPARAATRVTATVEAYESAGAHAQAVTVAGRPGHVLTGGGSGFTLPTLVTGAGQRTVAVTLDASPGSGTAKDLLALGALALRRTGG